MHTYNVNDVLILFLAKNLYLPNILGVQNRDFGLVCNYASIDLTKITCRILERCINTKL